MEDAPRPSNSDDEAPTPKWVYTVVIVVIILALLLVGMHLSGGGIPSHLTPP
jgi:hypothetical protein